MPEYIHVYKGKIYKEPLKEYKNKKTNNESARAYLSSQVLYVRN
jgi:hypothetical protein